MSAPVRPVRPRLAAFGVLLLAVTAAAGCGLFATAEPELPDSGASIPPDFTLPDSLLATFERAVERRESSNYGLCFSDSVNAEQPGFYASFDLADLADWQNDGNPPPGLWTLEDELVFFPRFLAYNTSAFYELTFTPDLARPDLPIDGSTQILNRIYRVFAAGSPVAAGSAGITIIRVGQAGEWKIRFWEDRRDTAGVRTWGTARLETL